MNILRYLICSIFFVWFQTAVCQVEMPDSLVVDGDYPSESFMRQGVPDNIDVMPLEQSGQVNWITEPTLSLESRLVLSRMLPVRFASLSPGISPIVSWDGGGITAYGNVSQNPGLMSMATGGISFSQKFGQLTLTMTASADKYGYFSGLQTGYGIGGNLSYRITQNLSLTLFGNYYTQLLPLTPAMAGYFNSSNFGGYLSYDFNDRWGVSVGAKTERSLYTGKWETRPIVTPYYKVSEKVSIGADVGGILYEVVRALAAPSQAPGSIPPPLRR
ncbi:MAG: hypothetical protein K2M94_04310 [Paramuribaculum sp.]|nr:hypothetical protein [Paramuribaculum sp.]